MTINRSFIFAVVLVGVFLQLCESVPSSFVVTSLGKQVFNSTGTYGQWDLNRTLIHPDSSKNCQYWKQSDKTNSFAGFYPRQSVKKGWVECVVDVSQLNGLGRSNNLDGVVILGVRDSSWGNVAALKVIDPSSGSGKVGVIMANWQFIRATEFTIPSGFHRFTLSYDYETLNITVYMDDSYVTSTIASTFAGKYALRYECGNNAGDNVLPRGTGKLYIKECNSFIPTITNLYVNAANGDDKNDGLTEAKPLKTIGAAAGKAMSGTTINIADGVYRESITSPTGDENGMVTFLGRGNKVYLSGSVLASRFNWTKGSDNIWSADVSSLLTKAPIFVTYKKNNGEFVRLHHARTPNYKVETPWKVTEFWNTAMGGKSIMDCFGQDKCDDSQNVDSYMLSDNAFKTMDDLTGAGIFMSDRVSGHYYYNSTITKHDKVAGTITTNKKRLFDDTYPGIGMYSQYYVFGKRFMIDEEGEYAYEKGKLYIKWSQSSLPDSLEFSKYGTGITVTGKKYIKIQNIHFTHYESYGILEAAGWDNRDYDSSCNIIINKCSFEYDVFGIYITHGTSNAMSSAHDWNIEQCNFTHVDGSAISLYSDADKHFPNVGIVNFYVANNNFYDLGFHSESNVGISVAHAKNFIFLNNTVKYVAHNGLQMSYSASKNGQISTGDSLFRGNLFDGICSGNSDCGCLKFWSQPNSHVWKNMLVTENLCQNTFGWTKTSYNRKQWMDRGYGGFGFFTDYVSGPVYYRNIVYNVGYLGWNIYKEWEDGTQTAVVNNLVVGSVSGFTMGGAVKDQTSQMIVKNNVFIDAALLGFTVSRQNYPTPYSKFDINNNLYYNIGWAGTIYDAGVCAIQDSKSSWQIAPTFEQLRKLTPNWETTEYWFDPQYGKYDSIFNLSYDERHRSSVFEDGTFAVTSVLVDKGTDKLPKIVTDLLTFFHIDDVKKGSNYDLGPYESGVKSWIPSSKKEGAKTTSSSENDDSSNTLSSANAFYLSIPVTLCCLLVFVGL